VTAQRKSAIEWLLVGVAIDVLMFLLLKPSGWLIPVAHLPTLSCSLWAVREWFGTRERDHDEGKEDERKE